VPRSSKTVAVTLWGATAEEVGGRLEQEADPILSIANCRVTDFNGAPMSSCLCKCRLCCACVVMGTRPCGLPKCRVLILDFNQILALKGRIQDDS
jgi:hypothetical protein